MDPLDDILKQIENQTHKNKAHIHNDQLNNICTGKDISDTQQESTPNRNNVNQTNGRMNNEKIDSVNNIPLHKTLRNIMEKVTLTRETDIEK